MNTEEKSMIVLGDEIYVDFENAEGGMTRLYMIVMDDTQDDIFYYGYAGLEDKIIGISKEQAVKSGKHFDSIPLDYKPEVS